MKKRSLAISIPVYNEAQNLPLLLTSCIETLGGLSDDWEILVVDDGSQDNSAGILKEWSAREKRIRVWTHRENQGFGPTLRDVFVQPSKEWVFFIPGDGQVPPSTINALLSHADDNDIIIARRTPRADGAYRRFQGWVYNTLVSKVMGKRIHDVDSSFLFHKRALDGITLRSQSLFVQAEFFLKASRKGIRIAETPVEHKARSHGMASGAKPKVILSTIRDFLRYALTGA